jgi:hypothetical protein
MPYKIKKTRCKDCGEACYKVINTETEQVTAKCSTLNNAKKQIKLLYGIERGWKPNSNNRF